MQEEVDISKVTVTDMKKVKEAIEKMKVAKNEQQYSLVFAALD